MRTTLLVTVALLLLLGLPAAADSGELVPTGSGWVRGRVTAETRVYQGIPYAEAQRWQPPRPPRPWPGVREATQPGPVCAQPAGGGAVRGGEDCLSLNIHRPQGTERLPVLVFVPGGGFSTGAGSDYDPARLAVRGRLLVVTLNYRLGALGFLAHPGLGPDAGNLGLQDQQAALRWVRAGIAGFGGDPGRVTLWGQSAGGYSVCAHLGAPGSRGLFQQAAVHSAPCANPFVERPEAERRARATAAELGCADAGCLRALPLSRLVGLHQDQVSVLRRDLADRPWQPVAATPTLPTQFRSAQVPLLFGGTADEMRPFVAPQRDLTAAAYPGVVTGLFGADAPAVLAEYPATTEPTPALTLARLLTDHGGVLGACTRLPVLDSARAPVHSFEFAEPTGHVSGDFPYGAAHSAELRYLLDLTGWPQPPLNPAQQALAERMITDWAAFVRTGDPGWGRGTTRFTAERVTRIDLAAEHRCGFWRTLG